MVNAASASAPNLIVFPCKYVCACVHAYTYVTLCMHTCSRSEYFSCRHLVCKYACVTVHMYVCMHAYIYIYIYIIYTIIYAYVP